jgi:hypothetical protein
MAMRARNIKPGFFKNEDLAKCDPLARLLFASLWCQADRDGRLEDRPARIKAEALPYDDCDVSALLQQLADHKFIIRYVADGKPCIEVAKFQEHQHPHPKEPTAKLPAPESAKKSQGITRKARKSNKQAANSQKNNGVFPLTESLNPSSLNPPSGPTPAAPMPAAPAGELARLWAMHCTRRVRGVVADRAEDKSGEFAEMLRHGADAAALEAAILDPARDRNEHLWQFRQRILPPATGPPAAKPVRELNVKALIEANQRARHAPDP